MKKKNLGPLDRLKNKLASRENLAWGLLASFFWVAQVFRLHDPSVPFPLLFLLKGLGLVAAAALVYQVSVLKKSFSFLGFFPLLWLSLSRFQWTLCAEQDFRYWLWLILFLSALFFVFVLADGKKLLMVLAPLWAGLGWLSPASAILPLVFLTASRDRMKNAGWIKGGGVLASILIFVLLKEWRSLGFNWVDLLDFLASSRYAAFLMLGWLGMVSFPPKGSGRRSLSFLFVLVLGYIFWPLLMWEPRWLDCLQWLLVFFAGFGWESFRRDLMDSSWHGRAVWFALGVSLFWGVV